MAKKRKKDWTEDQRAFDERTRMIEEYLERKRREIEAAKAGKSPDSSG